MLENKSILLYSILFYSSSRGWILLPGSSSWIILFLPVDLILFSWLHYFLAILFFLVGRVLLRFLILSSNRLGFSIFWLATVNPLAIDSLSLLAEFSFFWLAESSSKLLFSLFIGWVFFLLVHWILLQSLLHSCNWLSSVSYGWLNPPLISNFPIAEFNSLF